MNKNPNKAECGMCGRDYWICPYETPVCIKGADTAKAKRGPKKGWKLNKKYRQEEEPEGPEEPE